MMKAFLISNLVFTLLVLIALQVHGFVPFDFETEFSQDSKPYDFSYEPQYFPGSNPSEPSLLSESEFSQDLLETQNFPKTNDEVTSMFPESELPKDSLETQNFPKTNDEVTSLFPESELPKNSLETQNFPEKTLQVSDNVFPKEFDYPVEYFESQQGSYEINALHQIKTSLPSPAPSPSPSEAPAPAPSKEDNTCKNKCSLKCRKEKFPLLIDICTNVCSTKCLLRYSVLIFQCTSRCAESMPGVFKSDKKKATGYVEYCYKKCIKKF